MSRGKSSNGSVKYQTVSLMRSLDARGESKFEAKQGLKASEALEGIYSQKSFHNITATVMDLVNHYREWNNLDTLAKVDVVDIISRLTADDIVRYISDKAEAVQLSTASNWGAYLEKMGIAIDRIQGTNGHGAIFKEAFKQALEENKDNFKSPNAHREQVNPEKYIDNVKSDEVRTVIALAEATAGRISEVSNVKIVDGVDIERNARGKISTNQLTSDNKLHIKYKGGSKEIVKEMPRELAQKIRAMANEKGYFHVSASTVRAQFRKAQGEDYRKGDNIHSIRAHGANEVWARAVAQGYSEKQADIIASEHLGHSRASITKEHYVRK